VEGLKPHPESSVNDAKKLLLFELRLEAKRYDLFQPNCEDEQEWQRTLRSRHPGTAEKLIKSYRKYKSGLYRKMFESEKG